MHSTQLPTVQEQVSEATANPGPTGVRPGATEVPHAVPPSSTASCGPELRSSGQGRMPEEGGGECTGAVHCPVQRDGGQ